MRSILSKLAQKSTILLILLIGGIGVQTVTSCSSDDSPHKSAVKKRITGISQKGPFAEGSNVTIYELNEKLEKTKKVFKGKTDSKGYFEIEVDELASPYIMLKVNGRYFNEVSGELSSVPITLNAVADVSEESEANINALTHLEHERVLKLVKSGKDFEAAKQQAQREVLGALGISVSGLINSESMNILGSSASDSVLLLVSILLQGGRTAGELVHLLTDFGGEIRDSGSVSESVKASVSEGLRDVDMGKVSENIKDLSPDAKVPDISPFLPPEEPSPPSSSSRPPSSSASGAPSSNSAYSPPSQGGGGYVPPASTPSSSSVAPPPPEWGEWEITTPATCDAPGSRTRTNGITTETEAIAQLEWGEWIITTPATPTTLAVGKRTCPNGDEDVKDDLNICGTDPDNVFAPEEEFCQAGTNAVKELCGGATYTSAQGCCKNKVYGLKREHYGIEKDQFCDERDGKTYVKVNIGTQTWMAENLDYNESSSSRCYDDNPANCAIYGRLYDWATAMALPSKCNTTFSAVDSDCAITKKGICPTGWHIPSNDEWATIASFVDTDAGTKLKATSGGWNNKGNGSSGNGTDDFGFAALPGGAYSKNADDSPSFNDVGNFGHWWSATEATEKLAYYRYIWNNVGIFSLNAYDKVSLRSVRCLQD